MVRPQFVLEGSNMLKKTVAYVFAFFVFVVAMPLMMWALSKIPIGTTILVNSRARVFIAAALLLMGIGVAVLAILYMDRIGQGGPCDGFGIAVHERTKKLMTQGPYGYCRNPMLLGTFLYLLAVGIFLNSIFSIVFPVAFILFMTWEVKRYEEPRLRKDFGEEYVRYKKNTYMFFPKLHIQIPRRK